MTRQAISDYNTTVQTYLHYPGRPIDSASVAATTMATTISPTGARSCVMHVFNQSLERAATCRRVIGQNWVNANVSAGQAFCVGADVDGKQQLIRYRAVWVGCSLRRPLTK